MKARITAAALILLLLLSSCAKDRTESNSDCLSVYRPIREELRTSGELVGYESIPLSENADPLQTAVYAIFAAPGDESLMPLPEGIDIVSAERIGRSAKLSLSSGYLNLRGMDKTLADYCLALTFCSIPEINYISVYVGSDIIESRLEAGDVILKNNVLSPDQVSVRVYYPLIGYQGLAFEHRRINLRDDKLAERHVLDALIEGPLSGQLSPALPGDTVLLSVYTNNGVCSVSFAQGFLASESIDPNMAELSIYSVVNSLTSLSDVSAVQFLIEGKKTDYIAEINVSEALTRKKSLSGSAVAE